MKRMHDRIAMTCLVLVSMSLTLIAGPVLADDLVPPPWPRDGAPNYSTAAEWEFLVSTTSPYDPDGVEVTPVFGDGLFGMPSQVLPGGDIAWTPYDGDGGYLGGALGAGPGTLNFRVGNWIDDEPLKIVWMQMTYDPGPAGLSPFVEFILPVDPLPIDRVELMSVTDTPIVGDPGGRWHRLEIWEIEPNPDFESIPVILPEGVLMDQVVIDTISTVPEPSALALLGLGGLVLAQQRKRA